MQTHVTQRTSRQLGFARFGIAILGVAFLAGIGCNRPAEPEPVVSTASVSEALSSCINVAETGDATLQNPPMNKNFGAAPILRVGGKQEALLQFDLSTIPAAAAIDSATLTLSITGGDDEEDDGDDACELDGKPQHHCPTVNVHRATAAWSEPTVTFTSFAQHFDAAVAGSLVVTSNHMAKSVNLTSLVTTWLTGAKPNYGMLLETRSKRGSVFVSREGVRPEQRPVLRVCFTTPDDHCAPGPCQNGATCANNATGYTCSCAPGYTGTNCETLVNNCASSPCLNGGACTNGPNSYACGCALGFTGTNCEINIDDCASAPCRNGGVCQDGVGSYTCHCAPGYTGTNCETLINNCAAVPCQNGGTCTSGVASYTCACPAGFTGVNCENNIDDCVGNACQNGATCIDGINAYTCSCPPDWGGAHCELNLNSCSQAPCLNGATCTNGQGNYTCSCAPGYSGTNCQVDINECASNPCHNGGICVDGVNSYTCTCSNGFLGTTCDTPPQLAAVTVPAVPLNPSLPHSTLSGQTITLTGVALNGATQFYWDFGDGTNTGWGAIADPNNLGARHTYVGSPGQRFFAVLTVREPTSAVSATAVYPVQIMAPNSLPDPRIAMAIDEGLWYLHVNLSRGTLPAGAPGYGLPYGSFADGGLSNVCAAAEAFERHGSRINGSVYVDPYASDVRRLLNETFANMSVSAVPATQDKNGNQIGVAPGGDPYQGSWGACSQALVLGLDASYVVPAGPAGVYGRTLSALSQDLADYIASQLSNGHGSYYQDAHATLWATLALSNYAKLGALVGSDVRTGLSAYLTSTRDSGPLCGGWGWGAPNDQTDLTATAAGLYESAFVGVAASDPGVAAGLGFLYRNWSLSNAVCTIRNGSMTSYAIQLALRSSATSSLANYGCDGSGGTSSFDWYGNQATVQTGIASSLVSTQSADGHWTDSSSQGGCFAQPTSQATAWSLSTLIGGGQTIPPQALICDCANLTFDLNQSVPLDGSCSYPLDPNRTIVSYQWDFNYVSANGFNPQATGVRATNQSGYSAYATYPIALRVTDDNPQGGGQSIFVCNVVVKPPPHCPQPSAGGGSAHTYHAALNVPVQFDATGSFDADADPLTFNWSLSGNGAVFGDAVGATPTFTYSAPGTYAIAVQVTDHPELNVRPYVAQDCTKTGFATVIVP